MIVAITGAGGRLGSSLRAALEASRVKVRAWDLPDIDLDRPETLADRVRAERPDLVFHCAAWTDVDACAADPELAVARNGRATGVVAEAAAGIGAAFVYVSTNEVFDGKRSGGRGYREDDVTNPPNPYGASKRAGEEAVFGAFSQPRHGRGRHGHGKAPGPWWIVRTEWLYGPPGIDFGVKILAAANRARREGSVLKLVSDEVGSPTRAADLAAALLRLAGVTGRPLPDGLYHLTNAGTTSRAGWAGAILEALDLRVPVELVTSESWQRASTPPPWGVLDTSRAAAAGITLRPWRQALADELPWYASLGGDDA